MDQTTSPKQPEPPDTEYNPDWYDPAKENPKDGECLRCWHRNDERVKGEHERGHSSPPNYATNTPLQEVEILKCPECELQWGY